MDFRDYRGNNAATKEIYHWLEEHADELMLGGLGWYPVPAPPDSDAPDRGMRTCARIHIDVRPRLVDQRLQTWTK